MFIQLNKAAINKMNLVSKTNSYKPNYDISHNETYLEILISPNREIIIIGKLDNNYCNWCSVTTIDDKEKNCAIFDYITNEKSTLCTNEYLALGTDLYTEALEWYKITLRRSHLEGMCWETPFGHYYGSGSTNHGSFFSNDLMTHFSQIVELADYRDKNKMYLSVLENYLDILKKDNDYRYYCTMSPVIKILENESYLRLASNRAIREKYLECIRASNDLYNRYMTVVR